MDCECESVHFGCEFFYALGGDEDKGPRTHVVADCVGGSFASREIAAGPNCWMSIPTHGFSPSLVVAGSILCMGCEMRVVGMS